MTPDLLYALALIVVVAGFLAVLDRRDRRAADERRVERAAHREEVQVLLQRIHAPELAAHQHATKDATPDEPAVGWDDDEGYWESKGYAPGGDG